MSSHHKPIFYDEKKLRWKIFLASFFLILLSGILIYTAFLHSIITLDSANISIRSLNDNNQNTPINKNIDYELIHSSKMSSNFEMIAFYVNWDDSSMTSLTSNINNIDTLIPEWLSIKNTGEIEEYDIVDREKVTSIINQNNKDNKKKIIPMIHNYNRDLDRFDSESLISIFKDKSKTELLINSISNFIKTHDYQGISLDFEDIPYQQQYLYINFLSKLNETLSQDNKLIYTILPFGRRDIIYSQYSKFSNKIIVMAYDYSWINGSNGPIAPNNWIDAGIRSLLYTISKEKLILSTGSYAYDWNSSTKKAESKTYDEIIKLARDHNVVIRHDQKSLNPNFQYLDKNNNDHDVWFQDSTSFFNSALISNKYGLSGMGLWRLGGEDQGIWNIINNRSNIYLSVKSLHDIKLPSEIEEVGVGHIYTANSDASEGFRELQFNETGQIINQTLIKYPYQKSLTKLMDDDYNKRIVLTFDDGPNPNITPKILDLLKKYNIKATFFVIGSEANIHSGLINRIKQEGHEIGNHTYFHSNIQQIPLEQLKFELKTTQKIIDNISGTTTKLFRAPYGTYDLMIQKDFEKISDMTNLGYYSVSYSIDPKDWLIKNSQKIAETILSEAENKNGGIVLLHDGGGNRNATVEALEIAIPQLVEKGYIFSSIHELLDLNQEDIMPTSVNYNVYNEIGSYAMQIQQLFIFFINNIFWIGVVIGIGRLLVIILMATVRKILDRKTIYDKTYSPSVSVIIPAWNEEKVINRTIENLLNMKFKKFRIIVVDDGSTDNTYQVAYSRFGKNRRVRILTKSNGGKSNAINYGISKSRAEIIIVQDADTIFDGQAIPNLIRHFKDNRIGAVAGNVKVGNRINLLTRLQALEYIISQNLDRRAFHLTNSISVVPGAIGAWRRKYIKAIGGFRSDTLAEDAELTFSLLAEGYKVVNEPEAIAYTEAPETTEIFMKQRFRWMFGTLQVIWKHMNYTFNFKRRTLGWITLPNVIIFNIFFPLISPIIDIFTILVISIAAWQNISNPDQSFEGLNKLAIFAIAFILVDYFVAVYAFLLEKKEQKYLLLLLPIQMYYYKFVMYAISIQSFLTAIKGPSVKWEIKNRTANVQLIGK